MPLVLLSGGASSESLPRPACPFSRAHSDSASGSCPAAQQELLTMDTLEEPCPHRCPGDSGFSSTGRKNPSAAEVRHKGGPVFPCTHLNQQRSAYGMRDGNHLCSIQLLERSLLTALRGPGALHKGSHWELKGLLEGVALRTADPFPLPPTCWSYPEDEVETVSDTALDF